MFGAQSAPREPIATPVPAPAHFRTPEPPPPAKKSSKMVPVLIGVILLLLAAIAVIAITMKK
jgi:hypothetical protein